MVGDIKKSTDGRNCSIRKGDLVNVPLADGTSTLGIIITIYAENSAVIGYTDENGVAMRKMVYVDDSE